MKYIVEFFGFNDGLPYPVWEGDNLEDARTVLNGSRIERSKVGHRLIQVIEEHPKRT